MMKNISIIDCSGSNQSSAEFTQIRSHLFNRYKDKYVFLNNQEIIGDNRLIKFANRFYMMLRVMLYSDILIINGINTSLYFPILSIVFRKKIILLIDDINLTRNNIFAKYIYEFKKN